MFRRSLILTALLAATLGSARGQASPTARAAGVFQIGGGLTLAKPDYGEQSIKGATIYTTFDFTTHWGIEGDVHLVNLITPTDIGEKTYLIGPRYVRSYGRLAPYAKLLVGRGVFIYEGQNAALAYNIYALGGGLDARAWRNINVRIIDFEYQKWPGYGNNGLTPLLATAGVAYSFH